MFSMYSFVIPLLMGGQQAQGAAEGGGGAGGIMTFLPFVAIIAIFYFLIIRPQNKKQKETKKMLEALKKGDRVVTIGGIHGVIQNVRDSTVVVKVDDGIKIEFSRSAVSSVEASSRDDRSEKNGKSDKSEDETPAESSEGEDK